MGADADAASFALALFLHFMFLTSLTLAVVRPAYSWHFICLPYGPG